MRPWGGHQATQGGPGKARPSSWAALCVPETGTKPDCLFPRQSLPSLPWLGSGQALMPGRPEVSELEASSCVPSLERAGAGRPFGADFLFAGVDPGCVRARFWWNPSSQQITSPLRLHFPIKNVGAVTAGLTAAAEAGWRQRFKQPAHCTRAASSADLMVPEDREHAAPPPAPPVPPRWQSLEGEGKLFPLPWSLHSNHNNHRYYLLSRTPAMS